MKLNNLSRLTALLMAIMMLAMSSAVAENSGTDIGDVTGGYLANTDAAVALIEAGYCSICAGELAQLSVATWPVEGYICLHDHLSALTVEDAYQYLYTLYLDYDNYYVYQAYINAHANHVTQATGDSKRDAVMCYNSSCTTNPITAPGPKHLADCLWYQETEYVYQYPITATPDVSTPDALKNALTQGATTITLTFTAMGAASYEWQTSTNPDADPATWTAISGATSSTYTLPITPAAVGQAYRCVASDGTISATFYLGGKAFFTWATSTEQVDTETTVSIAEWLALAGNKMEYVFAAYDASLKDIVLAEVIHVTTIQSTAEDGTTIDALCLLELHGLSTLGEIDSEGNVIDTRYHIAVATYDATTGTITALGN